MSTFAASLPKALLFQTHRFPQAMSSHLDCSHGMIITCTAMCRLLVSVLVRTALCYLYIFEIIRRICMLSDLAEVGAVRNENTALWRIYQVGSLYRSVEFECSRTSIVRVPLYFVLFATALHAFPYACPTLFGMICIYPPPSYSHHQDYYLF